MLQWAAVGSTGARGIRHRSAKGLGDIHKVRSFGIYQVKGAHWIFEITDWLFHEENGKGTFLSEDADVFVIISNRRIFFFPETENLNFGD